MVPNPGLTILMPSAELKERPCPFNALYVSPVLHSFSDKCVILERVSLGSEPLSDLTSRNFVQRLKPSDQLYIRGSGQCQNFSMVLPGRLIRLGPS